LNYDLKNEILTLCFDEHGAELTSIRNNLSNTEYLWNADPNYWKRHSPILFPLVGSLKNKSYHYQGKTYSMPQHGFARDMDFRLLSKTDSEIWFFLEASEETLAVYPFCFRLEAGYKIEGGKITVLWKVINQDSTAMYFSIGGHPAFHCPLSPEENQTDYFLCFDTDQPIYYQHINEKGLLIQKPLKEQNKLFTDHGTLPVNPHLFDYDALIIEENQCHRVDILTPEKTPYLTVSFDAPLFGLWSPAGKNAPFLCIEPWYGRCDTEDFDKSLEEREWSNRLEPGEVFKAAYTIEI
jgi:galactose mutarotase-like enzyme